MKPASLTESLTTSFTESLTTSFTESLTENSIYTTDQEKQAFLADKEKVMDSLMINFFGFLGLFSMSHKRGKMKLYPSDEGQVRIENIKDDNLDPSISIKLFYELNAVPVSVIKEMTRLLAAIKQRKIKSKDFNQELVREMMKKVKLDSNRPSPRIYQVAKKFRDGDINIDWLAYDLYKLAKLKENKPFTVEFRKMVLSGYNLFFVDMNKNRNQPNTPNQPATAQIASQSISQPVSQPTQTDGTISATNTNLKNPVAPVAPLAKDNPVLTGASKAQVQTIKSQTPVAIGQTKEFYKEFLASNSGVELKRIFAKYGIKEDGFDWIDFKRTIDKMNQWEGVSDIQINKDIIETNSAFFRFLTTKITMSPDLGVRTLQKLFKKTIVLNIIKTMKLDNIATSIRNFIIDSFTNDYSKLDLLANEILLVQNALSKLRNDYINNIFEIVNPQNFEAEQNNWLLLRDLYSTNRLTTRFYEARSIDNFHKHAAFIVLSKIAYRIDEIEDFLEDGKFTETREGFVLEVKQSVIEKNSKIAKLAQFMRDAGQIVKAKNQETILTDITSLINKGFVYKIPDLIKANDYNVNTATDEDINTMAMELNTKIIEDNLINGERMFDGPPDISNDLSFFFFRLAKRNLELKSGGKLDFRSFTGLLDAAVLPKFANIHDKLFELFGGRSDPRFKDAVFHHLNELANFSHNFFVQSNPDIIIKLLNIIQDTNKFFDAQALSFFKQPAIPIKLYSKFITIGNKQDVLQRSEIPDEVRQELLDSEPGLKAEILKKIEQRLINTEKLSPILKFYDTMTPKMEELFTKILNEKNDHEATAIFVDPRTLPIFKNNPVAKRIAQERTAKIDKHARPGAPSNTVLISTKTGPLDPYFLFSVFSNLDMIDSMEEQLANPEFLGKMDKTYDLRWFINYATNDYTKLSEKSKDIIFKFISDLRDDTSTSTGKLTAAPVARRLKPRNKVEIYERYAGALLEDFKENGSLAEVEKRYKGNKGLFKKAILDKFSQYVLLSEISESLMKTRVRPDEMPTPDRIPKLLKYNNLTIPGITLRKTKSINDIFNSKIAEIKQLLETIHIEPIEDQIVASGQNWETFLERRSVEYDVFNKGKHGNVSVLFKDELNVNIPNQHEGWANFFEEKPDARVMNPVFHGTGSVAASFILRYGFAAIEPTDATVTGRMLGNGIYYSNVLDKIAQYVNNLGHTSREAGNTGYVFQMKAAIRDRATHKLLTHNLDKDYAEAGTGGDTIISPEWCVRDPRRQLIIYKAFKAEIIPKREMQALKNKHKINENTAVKITTFKEFLYEAKQEDSNTAAYTFMDGRIPVDIRKEVDFEDFKPERYGSHVRLELSAYGPVVVIESKNLADHESYIVRYTDEFMSTEPENFVRYLDLLTGKF